jgi:hypothetical protein
MKLTDSQKINFLYYFMANTPGIIDIINDNNLTKDNFITYLN